MQCKLYGNQECTTLGTNSTLYTDILIDSALTQSAVQSTCTASTCGEDAVCVNAAVDALGAQRARERIAPRALERVDSRANLDG